MTSVLVVEDDVMFAKAVGRDLAEQGFAVSVVSSVGDALSWLEGHPIDVVLTDLRLGAQDGIDLLESLRDVAPRARAVLMSGFATARDYQRAVELGAVRVLCKPFTPGELIQCIRQAVECETGYRGSVHGLSMVDILQMFNYGRRSVCINVSGARPGRVHLREGRIIHAEHEGRTGEDALRTLLAIPDGALSTTSLLPTVEQTVTRDFREVLLDALRAVDEDHAAADDELADLDLGLDLDGDDDDDDEAALSTLPVRAAHDQVLERVRDIDGYVAACLILASNGGVLGFDGDPDLRPAARYSAEVVRQNQRTVERMGLDDEVEDVLITAATQYHLLRALHTDVPVFVHLVLDRRLTNPILARLELARAVESLDL